MLQLEEHGNQETDKMLDEHQDDDNLETLEPCQWKPWSKVQVVLRLIIVSLFVAVALVAILLFNRAAGDSKFNGVETTGTCHKPTVRKEWRYLNKVEKDAFLSATLCLFQKRSIFPHRGSMYDDIVFVHQHSGQAAHKRPSFFPWHRWFIYQFERMLQNECGYEGSLPYWDWTLDWQNLSSSSIWDDVDGFGGQHGKNVEVSIPEQVDHEMCVSGPFKDVTLFHFNLTVRPHCLSRHFQLSKSEDHGTFSGELMSPDSMGQLARSPNYGILRYGMEELHNIIHNGVLGDLNTWSSANDPIFWLHHAQLDRLWWIWQLENPEERVMDYGDSPGQPRLHTIDDEMEYLGLFENRTVSEVMRTDTELLCYSY